MAKVIGIFTGKDLKWMESEGGSGYWIVRTDRIKSAEYVILIRNHRETWAVKDGLGHGQAFMVGKISGCIPTKKHAGRKLIQISEYALLPDTENFKRLGKLTAGQRYPVAYLNTNDLLQNIDLDVEKLEWSALMQIQMQKLLHMNLKLLLKKLQTKQKNYLKLLLKLKK